MDINSSRGMSHGATFEKVQVIEKFRESPLFDAAERTALPSPRPSPPRPPR
jgi:hypothetical protein